MDKIEKNLPFKVKDISLAKLGRKKLELAESQMPGLMRSIQRKNLLKVQKLWVLCT